MASRQEVFAKLGITKPIAEPLLDAAFELEEEQIWREDLQSSPHGEHWHLSFHVSSFPGDDHKACGRKALYSLMNIPAMKPVDRAGRAVMEAGKAIEEIQVWRFYRSGALLTQPPSAKVQQGFEDKEYWLTGSPDAVIQDYKHNRPYPVEVKTKDGAVIEKMKMGQRSYDAGHRNQALGYIGFTTEKSKELWPQLEVCTEGCILYVSRDRPNQTHEFKFKYSETFMEQGRIKLDQWRDAFQDGLLPERNPDWKWTETPCKWCPVKPVCKQDVKDKVIKLKDSNAIKHAKEVRSKIGYDYKQTRTEVLERWGANDNE
jgi:hypothetical protein